MVGPGPVACGRWVQRIAGYGSPLRPASCLGRRMRPGRASWKPGEAGAEGRARGPLREPGSVLCPAEAVRPPHRVDSGPGGMGTGRGRILRGANFREDARPAPCPPPPGARRPGGARVRTQRIRAGGRRPPRRGPGAGRGGRRGGSAARGLGAARRDPQVGSGRAGGAGRGREHGRAARGPGSDVGGPPGAEGPGPRGRLSRCKRAPGSLGPREGRLLSPRRRGVAAGGGVRGAVGTETKGRAGRAPRVRPRPAGPPPAPQLRPPSPPDLPPSGRACRRVSWRGPFLRADSPPDGLARGPFPQRARAPRAGGFEA